MTTALPQNVMDEFLDELRETTERIVMNLTSLEKSSSDPELLRTIYRDVHTIKGNSMMFGLPLLSGLSHSMENTLEILREQQGAVTAELGQDIFAAVDLFILIANALQESGREPPIQEQITELKGRFEGWVTRLSEGNMSRESKDAQAQNSIEAVAEKATPDMAKLTHVDNREPVEATKTTERPELLLVSEGPAIPSLVNQNLVNSFHEAPLTQEASQVDQSSQGAEVMATVATVDQSPLTNAQGTTASQTKQNTVAEAVPAATRQPAKSAGADVQAQESIRVHVGILDKIMNLVGELVLVRNQFEELVKVTEGLDVQVGQRLSAVTSELQQQVMKTRMQPVGNVFNKFHRVIRDLCRDLDKDIELVVEGAETELDKALVEAIRDPLMHIVRNSADHGIEMPDARRGTGKDPKGSIRVSASQQGGQVLIEISDDGRGMDVQRIRAKAAEKGLFNTAQIAAMNDEEVIQLIFHPGFSTADKVSSVSGRGVGMDVVKTNIEAIGGSVELRSQAGIGSSTILKIPLTLAIMPSLVVKVGVHNMAIPQSRLVELICIEQRSGSGQKIEALQGKAFYRLRGDLLPLVDLRSVLDGDRSSAALEQFTHTERVNVVVVDAEGQSIGLVVDSIDDSMDVVIKALGQSLSHLPLYSGATILGDGSIALMMDINGLVKSLNLKVSGEDARSRSRQSIVNKAYHQRDEIDYLIVRVGAEQGRYVIPVCNIKRLEEFRKRDLNIAGDRLVARYRGSLLPIFDLKDSLLPQDSGAADQPPSLPEQDAVQVIVVSYAERLFGIQVDGIVDVLISKATIEANYSEIAALAGSFVDKESVYMVIDVFKVIEDNTGLRAAIPGAESSRISDGTFVQQRGRFKLFLVEDSSFFRKQISSFLSDAGYQVAVAADGAQAWDTLSTTLDHYDLVVSDIEMPEVDGIELARRLRGMEQWQKKPIIAVTSKFSKTDVEKGVSAGFTLYTQKLNKEELIYHIDQQLGLIAS